MKKRSALLIAAAAVFFAACNATTPPKKDALTKDGKKPGAGAAEAAPAAPAADVTEASLRTGGFESRDNLKTVQFDYDSAKLSDATLALLKANADVLKEDETLVVEVSGHCDERGTTAYNLALGQKRAKEVRDYYIRLGVDGSRVATISYGKEQPVCNVSDDACWARNRRAETKARVKK